MSDWRRLIVNRKDAEAVDRFDDGVGDLPLDIYIKALSEAMDDALGSGDTHLHTVLESLRERLPELARQHVAKAARHRSDPVEFDIGMTITNETEVGSRQLRAERHRILDEFVAAGYITAELANDIKKSDLGGT